MANLGNLKLQLARDADGTYVRASLCVGDRCFAHEVKLDPIIAAVDRALTAYHRRLHGADPDTSSAGWLDDVGNIARRVASSDAAKFVATQAQAHQKELLAAGANLVVPGGGALVFAAYQVSDVVAKAKEGDPDAKAKLGNVVQAARGGDPTAQGLVAIARRVNAKLNEKAADTRVSGRGTRSHTGKPAGTYKGDTVRYTDQGSGSGAFRDRGGSMLTGGPSAGRGKAPPPPTSWYARPVAPTVTASTPRPAAPPAMGPPAPSLYPPGYQADQGDPGQGYGGDPGQGYDPGYGGGDPGYDQDYGGDPGYDDQGYDDGDGGDAAPSSRDHRVSGWLYNRPYRTVADHLVDVQRSPGVSIGLRELYNQGLGRPRTSRDALVRRALAGHGNLQGAYDVASRYSPQVMALARRLGIA